MLIFGLMSTYIFWPIKELSTNYFSYTSVTSMCRNDELSWLFTNRFSASK